MILRRQPGDFVVVERLTAAWRDRLTSAAPSHTGHAIWELTKTSLTTPEAAARLAKALGTKPGLIAHAGLKDKHAVTTQHVTAPAGVSPAPALAGPGWSARRVGWSDEPIDARAIESNAFQIVVRGLTRESSRDMEHRCRLLSDPARTADAGNRLLVVNYFGDQRFGSARHGEGFAGAHLVRGEFEAALRLLIATPARKDTGARRAFTRLVAAAWAQGAWKTLLPQLPACPERRAIECLATGGTMRDAFAALPNMLQQLAVDAFQSHLWNQAAVRLARQIASHPEHALSAPDPFGAMLFPAWSSLAPDAPDPWRSATIPMPEPAMAALDPGPGAAAMLEVLRDAGLSPADMRVPGLRRPTFGGTPRAVLVEARDVLLEPARADEFSTSGRGARRVAFTLPRGAYATVVLRALGG